VCSSDLWFYDNPFNPEHYKSGTLQAMVMPIDPGLPSNITVAINWSTDAWSLQDPPPDGPPLPGVDEALFIGRQIIYTALIGPAGVEIFEEFVLPVPYNPEWVSVDIQGINFQILPGSNIWHECVTTSLDLSFVINGHALTGACCYPDGNCAVMTQAACLVGAGNSYAGDGTTCLGDGNQNGVDDACEGTIPTGACCWADGTCSQTTSAFCTATGAGTYLGDNTVCLGDLDGNGTDDACEQVTNTGACCWPDGSCGSGITRMDCVMGAGHYMGDGSVCLGDGNQNGTDDLCEQLPELKYFQPPDLTPTGMDVDASFDEGGIRPNLVLADDFLCTQTGPITEIHVFGSWFGDLLPQGSASAVRFVLSIHPDVPAGELQTWSMPGPALWLMEFLPGTFEVRVHAGNIEEGWFTPPLEYLPVGDRVCYEYIFYLGPNAFIQQGTPESPVIYWLDVQAWPTQQGTYFGWKTSMTHWNDDAVYFIGMDEIGLQLGWFEMRYPDMHPYHPESIDLAFQIWGLPTVEPTGACCYPDGSCAVMTQTACLAGTGNSYAGDGTACLGDLNANGVDDQCEQYVPSGACCLLDGSCALMTSVSCAAVSGQYLGNGSVCLGDNNANGVDDACEEEEPLKWEQPPDLTPNGMDVMGTLPVILADDFLCTVTGQIVAVDVYASWYHDMLPGGPENVRFSLSLHEDIPDPDGPGPEYSKPGDLICIEPFDPGSFEVELFMQGPEGWYDPTQELYEFPGDQMCWKYTFRFRDPCWVQSGTEAEPKVYWLNVQAFMLEPGYYWGWKTSVIHWNDDAVWATGEEPQPLTPWMELRYPPMHPFTPQSVDLAFAVYTTTDTCAGQYPGDFDCNGELTMNDLSQLINHVQFGGPPSAVPSNGDVNGDCRVNSYDVDYLNLYLNFQGPAPVDCTCLNPYGYCCYGEVGNVNCSPDETPTIGDISSLIDFLFISQNPSSIPCIPEADVNQSGGVNPILDDLSIGDISVLIDYLFISGPDMVDLHDCFPAP